MVGVFYFMDIYQYELEGKYINQSFAEFINGGIY
jgi:hypothetical protein